jgi:hypothetical protein
MDSIVYSSLYSSKFQGSVQPKALKEQDINLNAAEYSNIK